MSSRRLALSLATLAAALGCRLAPDTPTAPEARAAANANAALLTRIERDVDAALAEVVRAQGCGGAGCDCVETRDALLPRCRGVIDARRARVREATDRFQRESVPTWTRDTSLLGAEVTLLLDRGATRLLGEVVPSTPGRRAGAVRAPRGELAPRSWQAEPGRGLYQTSWTRGDARYGDGAYHRGIELHWTLSRGAVRAWITAWVLIDGWQRPAGWPVR